MGVGGVSSSRARVLAMLDWAFGATEMEAGTHRRRPYGRRWTWVRTWTGYRGSAIRDASDRAGRAGATRSVRQSATDTVREDSDRDAFGSRAGGDGRTWRCRRSAPRAPPWEWRWQTCALDWDGRRAVQRPAIVPGPRQLQNTTVGSVGTRGFDFGALRLFIRRGRERKRYLPRHGCEPKKRRIKPPV